MSKYIQSFKEDYQDGRQDTKRMLGGEEMPYQYAYNITRFAYRLLFISWIISFLISWLIFSRNLFLSFFIGFLIGWVVYALYLVGVIGLISLVRKVRRNKR